jgi:hypothetical protein
MVKGGTERERERERESWREFQFRAFFPWKGTFFVQ